MQKFRDFFFLIRESLWKIFRKIVFSIFCFKLYSIDKKVYKYFLRHNLRHTHIK